MARQLQGDLRLKSLSITGISPGQSSSLSVESASLRYVTIRRPANPMLIKPLLLSLIVLIFAGCRSASGLPEPSSPQYREAVSAFYVGLAALQTGEDVRAREKLTRLSELAPGEPAGWANLGVLALRQQDFDLAFQRLDKARELAPENSQILSTLGTVESKRGHLPEAIKYLRAATERDPKNLKAIYSLAQETERQGGEANDKEAQALAEKNRRGTTRQSRGSTGDHPPRGQAR